MNIDEVMQHLLAWMEGIEAALRHIDAWMKEQERINRVLVERIDALQAEVHELQTGKRY